MSNKVMELVRKVQDINGLSLEQVTLSIGYSVTEFEKEITEGNDAKLIDLLFLKHPNSLKSMSRKFK